MRYCEKNMIPPSKVPLQLHYKSFSYPGGRTESKIYHKIPSIRDHGTFTQNRLNDYSVQMHRVPQPMLVQEDIQRDHNTMMMGFKKVW